MEIQTAYLSLEGARELAAPGAATRFEIHLSDVQGGAVQEAIEAAKARLVAALDEDLTVETWREAAPDLATILDIMDPMMMVFAFFIFVLAGLFVVNTIYLGLVERIREFGVIIAVGADRRRVMRMVFAESLALVLTGSAAGLAVSGALVAWMSKGVRFPGFEEVLAELGMPTVFYSCADAGPSGDHDGVYDSDGAWRHAVAGVGSRQVGARGGDAACGVAMTLALVSMKRPMGLRARRRNAGEEEIGLTTPILRAVNLSKIYSTDGVQTPALQGVDLEVAPGEFTAIAGPSGSGKSTLLHLLGCLDQPTSGETWLGELRTDQLDPLRTGPAAVA